MDEPKSHADIKTGESSSTPTRNKRPPAPTKKKTLWGSILSIAYIAAILFQVWTIVKYVVIHLRHDKELIAGKILIWVAMSLGFLMTMFSIYMQNELEEIESLREVIDDVRAEVDKLKIENENLNKNVTNTEAQVQLLQESETKLNEITKDQNMNAEGFVALMRQNKNFLDKMDLVIKQRAIQDLTAIVLRSDTDRDNDIEGAEIDTLILRLSLVNGITLNEKKLKERVIAEGGDVRAVQRLVNRLQHEDENDPHRLFVVDKESLKSQMEMGM